MSKKNRLRECPAAGRAIEAYECAVGRHTAFACPEQCPFNPFSAQNYEAYGKIEGGADVKFFNYLIVHAPNPAEFDRMISRTLGGAPNSDYFHALAWHAVYKKAANGDTCLEKWAKQGLPDLTKDEQIVAKGKMQMRPAVVEVQRVLDDRQVQVVDLLDPHRHPFILVDRVLAKLTVRFGVYAIHTFPLPHFHRLFGTAYTIPSLPPLDPEEIVREIILHFGGGSDEPSMRRWLMQHYPKFEAALLAVGLARRKAMFENLDAQFGKAVYELAKPFEECKDRLRGLPQVQDDPLSTKENAEGFLEGRVWFASAGDPERDVVGEGAALGRILLGRTHWRLDCMGGSRLDRLRDRFESLMGECVRFSGERRDDIATQLRLRESAYNEALVPPKLLRDPAQITTAVARVPVPVEPRSKEAMRADFLSGRYIKWLDEPVPALRHRTPRAAAADPALRPELIRLMKERIRDCDTRNLETGRNDDINWMLRDLGLDEILFDPPPPRPPVKLSPDVDDEDGFDDDETDAEWLDWPDPPPLPDRPLTKPQALARFQTALASFPRMTEAFDYLAAMDYPLFEDLREIVGDLLTDREHQFLAPILSLLVLSFAPRGTLPPEINYDDLAEAVRREVLNLDASSKNFNEQIVGWLSKSRQPEVLMIYLSVLAKLSDEAPKSVRPRESARTSYLILLRVVVDELDRVMREHL